ncbi:hypothetical protein OROMI_006392 [Orobanche minor]
MSHLLGSFISIYVILTTALISFVHAKSQELTQEQHIKRKRSKINK